MRDRTRTVQAKRRAIARRAARKVKYQNRNRKATR
jgi:hypothetical protein